MTVALVPPPPTPLDMLFGQTGEHTLSDIPRNLAGVNALLFGALQGGDVLDDGVTPNPARRAPSTGKPAHDHTGGEFGKGFGLALATFSFDRGETYDAGGWSLNPSVTRQGISWSFSTAASFYSSRVLTLPVDVPGCDTRNGVYRQLGVRAVLDIHSTSGMVAGELKFRVVNRHPEMNKAARDLEVPSITTTGQKRVSSANTTAAPLVPVVPGQRNPIEVWYHIDGSGSSGTRNLDLELLEITLGVYEV